MKNKTLYVVAAMLVGGVMYAGLAYELEQDALLAALEQQKSLSAAAAVSISPVTADRTGRAQLAADVRAQIAHYNADMDENEAAGLADKILEVSGKYNLPPQLLLALIGHESSWNNRAVSNKGAVGLMQLLPSTASEVAKKLDIPMPRGRASLNDPEVNIELGSYYLAQLIERFDDVDLALTAYNAGPNRVARQLERNRPVTSHYATTILANATR